MDTFPALVAGVSFLGVAGLVGYGVKRGLDEIAARSKARSRTRRRVERIAK